MMARPAKTDIIIAALQTLAEEIETDDGVASGAMIEAAVRLDEMQVMLRKALDTPRDQWSKAFERAVRRAIAPGLPKP